MPILFRCNDDDEQSDSALACVVGHLGFSVVGLAKLNHGLCILGNGCQHDGNDQCNTERDYKA